MPDLSAHFGAALELYSRQLRRDGRRVPPEIAALAGIFSASNGQERPTFDGPERGVESDQVLAFTYAEAGAQLNVSERTIRRAVALGDLVAVEILGSKRIRGEDLRRYLSERPPVMTKGQTK